MSQFSGVQIDTKYALYKSFCMSAYGCQLWDFSHKVCEKYYTSWRKCIRRIFSLSPRTHSSLLHLICLDCPIDVQLHMRFIKFFHSCVHSKNTCVNICSKLAINGSQSDICHSLTYICEKYNLCRYSIECKVKQIKDVYKCTGSEADLQTAALIRDFKGYNVIHNDPNVSEIILDLCVN
jgi:hypothetical protein